MEEIVISDAIVKRLPRYYRYLEDLIEEGVERISSKELSERMGVTASQIRQDLNHFGGFGQQGYGYKVNYLHDEIGKILGIDQVTSMIMIGAGNLGTAIANYTNYRNRGFVLEAIFDRDPEKIGKVIQQMTVQDISELPAYLREHKVGIAALTIPKQEAIRITQILVDNGVKAIWNFAHTDLQVPDDVAVENVHLSESLMRLSYTAKNKRKQGE